MSLQFQGRRLDYRRFRLKPETVALDTVQKKANFVANLYGFDPVYDRYISVKTFMVI